ncbi:outer membrane protein assembly factor BamA [Alteriqipengyuania lutimaris]|uniref:Outer membrane protein assembly factor BamA n=1 Tax=Alteriqipengyuania lutimaris TaxID=1538146 RepID=A0A395LMY2_9SPHN|nr:outer membrane protein assembly factor BamA [Alteriqipengyuania lutimaris]MBB3032571.1 outer membrane protein insertion porin family [Alteriqipengyuania lutimaris]RDS78302.1 outer membrane protein assembly factor BamA [Alteriqipengyuania lutimaris]
MTAIETGASRRLRNIPKFAFALLAGTTLAGLPQVAFAQDTGVEAQPQSPTTAQDANAQPDAAADTAQGDTIRTISVQGVQRLEPQTILSYVRLRPGEPYTTAAADQALKDLAATELFSDYEISNENGNVLIEVVENPVINRIILEGNERLKDDKIVPEIRLAPRQIFTRSKVRADVARIIELYKRQGRFAATVEPKTVQLSQNRVDLVFEITEGPKSRVQQINIIGNDEFSDGELKGEMVTKETSLFSFLSGNTSYDPDRLAFDQQKLREFYLTQGYVDFRVVSAVAELTPDKRDFIITYVVEEGDRYQFGDVEVTSEIRDFDGDALTNSLTIEEGQWYNAKTIEDTVEQLSELAGRFGYAFADVRPQFRRNPDERTMDVTLLINEAPRVYIERIDVNGNTLTQDKVIRREFRSAEGDAFNSTAIDRTTARINSLGFFQEGFEVQQVQTAEPDRIILEANVEEQPTGELQLSAGFSSIESFLFSGSIRQRNFRGRGQTIGASAQVSRFSNSVNLSFTEPYLFDRNISLGLNLYRQDVNSYSLNDRDQTRYKQVTTGGSARVGVPLTEYSSLVASYTLNYDQVTINENEFFEDFDGDGIRECEPLLATRYICDVVGDRVSSILGLNYIYNSLNSYYRPTRGERINLGLDFAGLGGDVKYVRVRGQASKYWQVLGDFIFSLSLEGGYIKGLEDVPGRDDVLLTDRFQLGEPQFRGFDVRGVGPRVLRQPIIDDGEGNPLVITDRDRIREDAIGGNAYYLGRAELEIPLGSGARELGLRPSFFVDVGSLFDVETPQLQNSPFPDGIQYQLRDNNGNPLFIGANGGATTDTVDADGNPLSPLNRTISPFQEVFLGNSASPRVSVGFGVNWNSPFGPFRIDLSHVILKEEGDDTKTLSFNVGTQF